MKPHLILVSGVSLFLTISTHAQFGARAGGMGGAPRGLNLGGSMSKLFGDNPAFSATLELQTSSAEGAMTVPGKISFDQGKSRFEMEMPQMQGAKMPPGAAAQMKAMGLDKMLTIARPDKKANYLVYPGLQAYTEMPIEDAKAEAGPNDFTLETKELGKETVDGHPCVKNKAVVTDKDGNKHESTVWNATDLKNFPVKIETNEGGTQMTMLFKDITLSKPEPALFDPPSDFTKYDNMMTMMQQVMMKRVGQGAPAGAPQPPPKQP